jgi:hypothetical protein
MRTMSDPKPKSVNRLPKQPAPSVAKRNGKELRRSSSKRPRDDYEAWRAELL